MAMLRITDKKSAIGANKKQKLTIRSLGFRKLNQTVLRPDNAAVRGMIQKVRHLVDVEILEGNDSNVPS